ncbi:MAG: hypothetical protein AB7Y74_10680 [Syntrophorhabdus sp.]
MHEPDIEKLRRFSLIVALIILTYSIAGISLVPNAGISVIGLTFKVSRPGLLPVGLAIASVYALIRFYYYGFMLKKSPYRARRNVIDSLHCHQRKYFGGRKKVPTYFGPTELSASLWVSSRAEAEAYVANFLEVFPKFAFARPSMKIEASESYTEDGESAGMSYDVKVVIPIRCRLAAIAHDIDYATPVWLNLASLIVFFVRIGLKGIYA